MDSARLGGQAVVILGMFRSGTSCLAGCLEQLGVFLGNPEAFFPPDQYNPGGYYELLPLIDVGNRLLDRLGNSSARLCAFPQDWEAFPGIGKFVQRIDAVLIEQFGDRPLWGWKSPQTSVLLPIYRSVLSRHGVSAVYPIAVRFPLDVAHSTRGSALLPSTPARLLGLWLHYTLSSLVETIGERRAVIVYESLLEQPRRCLEPLAGLLQIYPDAWTEVERDVRPGMRHQIHGQGGLDDWPPLVGEVYRFCLQLAEDTDGLNQGRYDGEIRELWNRWQRMNAVSILRASEFPRGRTSAVWNSGAPDGRFELPFAPVEGWQTLRIPVPEDAPSRVSLDLYQTPGIVWIRRAEWVLTQSKRAADLFPTANGRLMQEGDLLKLRVYGPYPLEAGCPRRTGEAVLELDVMFETDQRAVGEVVGGLREELAQLRAILRQGSPKR